jgi:RNA polymerase sigma-70 factor (ECF subfamily)
VNTILDELRKEKRSPYKNPVDFERTNLEVIDDTPEESLYSSKEIKDAVETLASSQKKVFEMFFFKNMPHQEIAEELGISEGTSKSNLFKAKAKVKQYLINLNKKRED